MLKRCLSLLLCASLILGLAFPARAAGENWQLRQVQVLYGGIADAMPVLQGQDGQLLTKLDSMTYYSVNMNHEEKKDVHIYYSGDSRDDNFSRHTFIDSNTGNFSVGLRVDDATMASYVSRAKDYGSSEQKIALLRAKGDARKKLLDKYFSQSNTQVKRIDGKYLLLLQGKFSQMVTVDEELWVPLEELLPLMDVHAFVSEDGRYLCMDPIQKTLYQVLGNHGKRAEKLLFDSEDVVGNDVMAGGGWIISAFTGEVHRLNPVLGKQMEYESLYEEYLVDNEVYLSTFQIEGNDTVQYITDVSQSAEGTKTIVSKGIEGVKGVYRLIIRNEPDQHHYMHFFDLGEDFFFAVGTAIDVAAGLMDYLSVYYNQVEDHRNMLMAVYGYSADKDWPSYKAAENVTALYNTAADNSEALVKTVLRDTFFEQVSDIAFGELYGSWYDVIEVGKVVFESEFEYIADSGAINMVSNNAQYAYSIFQDRLFAAKSAPEDLEKTRLCLMMALLASRHAYNTYWDGMRQDDVDAIDEILKELYTAGRWDVVTNNKSYKERRDELCSELESLSVQINDPVTVAENYMVAQTLKNDYWYPLDRWEPPEWYLYDANGDQYDELFIHHWIPHFGEYMTIQVDPKRNTVTESHNSHGHTYHSTPVGDRESTMVFGDTELLLQSLKTHFGTRDGFLGMVETDLNGDGKKDHIYGVYRAAEMYNRILQNNLLELYDYSISLVTALTTEDGVELRFFCDVGWDAYSLEQTDPDQWNTRLALPMSFQDGTLMVAGESYGYEDGVFMPLRTNASGYAGIDKYLMGHQDLMDEPEAQVSYIDPADLYEVLYANNIYISDAHFIQYIGYTNQVETLQLYHYGQEITLEGNLTTRSTIREIVEGLSNVVTIWDNTPVYGQERFESIMGPYPLYGMGRELYETCLCWQLSDGSIFMVLLHSDTESLDVPAEYMRFDRVS